MTVRGSLRDRIPAPSRRQSSNKAEGPVENSTGPSSYAKLQTSDGLEVRGLGATGIRHDVERDLLAFVQGAHARRFHGSGMDEHVLAAAFRRDEAKALGGIEEFHGSDSHMIVPAKISAPAECRYGTGVSGLQGRKFNRCPGAHSKAGRDSLGALLCNGP